MNSKFEDSGSSRSGSGSGRTLTPSPPQTTSSPARTSETGRVRAEAWSGETMMPQSISEFATSIQPASRRMRVSKFVVE